MFGVKKYLFVVKVMINVGKRAINKIISIIR